MEYAMLAFEMGIDAFQMGGHFCLNLFAIFRDGSARTIPREMM